MHTRRVLVFGDDTRSFLAIVRSLGRRGIVVDAAASNFRSPALRSRYIRAIHELPPWMGDGTEWLDTVLQLLSLATYDLVIPCDETTLLPLQKHRAELSELTQLAIPDDRSITILFDKHETRELATQVHVRVPLGRLTSVNDTADRLLAELGAPVVLKPRRSYSLADLSARAKVRIIDEPKRLRKALSECDFNETLAEEFFPGTGVGVSVLASCGRVLQAFEHHRVREIAGASFYRVSAALTPELLEACKVMLAQLGYTGVAMFEFKQHKTKGWALLEINARPWGSMPLPVALGVDFPYQWYRLLVLGETTDPSNYRTGVYGRNLFPDLRNSMLEAEARHLSRIGTVRFISGRMLELLRLLTRREVHDVFTMDDPRPGAFEFLEFAGVVVRRLGNLVPGALERRRRRSRTKVAKARVAEGEMHILFVCQGNICRSPFAAALLGTRCIDQSIAISSAGTLPKPGRPVPNLGIEAAAIHGIDLSGHRSVWLSRNMLRAASLLIVFDDITKAAVLDRYPDTKTPMILLGELAGVGQIGDPVDGDARTFRQTYSRIQTSIGEMAAILNREQPNVTVQAPSST